MSLGGFVIRLVHNEFMPLNSSPSPIPIKSRLGLQAAFYFSAFGFFTPLEATAHATATRPLPSRQPLDPIGIRFCTI
jgi:hypothetical protein